MNIAELLFNFVNVFSELSNWLITETTIAGYNITPLGLILGTAGTFMLGIGIIRAVL